MSVQSYLNSQLLKAVKEKQRTLSCSDTITAIISEGKFSHFFFKLQDIILVMCDLSPYASSDTIMVAYNAFSASLNTPTPAPTAAPTFTPTLGSCTPISNLTQLALPSTIFADDIGSNIASGIRIVGGTSAGAGSTIAVGDIDNDGREDIIIGAPKVNKIYVVMGNTLTEPNLNVTAIEADVIPGIIIKSESIAAALIIDQNNLGTSVASGDINLDGYDDIAFIANEGVCIVFGGANLPKIINIADMISSNLGVCTPVTGANHITVTDFNGDGPNDLIVPGNDQINIFLGNPSLSSTTNLEESLLSIRLTNDTTYSYEWASAIGDVNGDFNQDLLITLNSFFPYAYVVFGIGNITAPYALDLFDIGFANDTAGVLLNGSAISGLFYPTNPSKNSGDFNNDGHNDIAILDEHGGDIFMIYGPFNANNNNIDISAIGTDGNDQGVLFRSSDLISSDRDRRSLERTNIESIFKDLNNDNITDFTLAYPGESDSSTVTSKACIIFGHNNPEVEIRLNSTSQITLIEGNYTGFGSSLATCDANCDGIPDLLVGAPFDSNSFGRRGINVPTPSPITYDDNVFIFFG